MIRPDALGMRPLQHGKPVYHNIFRYFDSPVEIASEELYI